MTAVSEQIEEHEAEADLRVRIYVPTEEGAVGLEKATTHPPAGSLDGWQAIDVDPEVWRDFETKRTDYRWIQGKLAQATRAYDEAARSLGEEIDRG